MFFLTGMTLTAPPALDVLFLGNSHTSVNSVPTMVKSILDGGGAVKSIKVTMKTGGALESISQDPALPGFIDRGKFTDIILQGAALSSSHKYTYSQEGAIKLAESAKKSGARVWLFAEWPRQGWDETPYILGIYREISRKSGAKIIPVCSVFDRLLKEQAGLEVWSGDGNHASLLGSYIGAATIAKALASATKIAWRPQSVSVELAKSIELAVQASGKPLAAKQRQ